MPRVVYPALTEPLRSLPTAIPAAQPAWAAQDELPQPFVSSPPRWLNAGGIVQPFVQPAVTPNVAAWAGLAAFPRPPLGPEPPFVDAIRPVLPPAQGALVLGWALVQEPKVWPVKPAYNDGTRPVLPPSPVTPTLGWAMNQDVRPPPEPPQSFVGWSLAGPLLPIAPVTPLSWRVIGDGAPPPPKPLPFHAFATPLIAFAPGGPLTLGWPLTQDVRPRPLPTAPPSPSIYPAYVPVAALTPLTWRANDAIPVRPLRRGFHSIVLPLAPVGPVTLGWQVQSPPMLPMPRIRGGYFDFGNRISFLPASAGVTTSPFYSLILRSRIIHS